MGKDKIRKVMLIVVIIIVTAIVTFKIITEVLNYNSEREMGVIMDPINIINNKFLKYEGITKGSVIRDLIQITKIYNENLKEGEKSVILEGGDNINNIEIDGIQTIEVTSIKNTKRYIVNINEYYGNGQVKRIYIEEVQEGKNNNI